MDSSEDPKVDILDCDNLTDESQEGEDGLSQSSSSSFGDSMCARDDDDEVDDNDFEAESMLNRDYPLPETSFGDGTELLGLRKKKLTDKWRRFCQPLMWRCKWLELKAKEIESQARWYDREVKSYHQSKQFDSEKSKLKPFGDQSERMIAFKRGRRRRVEETTDVSAYISNHNVFSYAEKRNPTTLKAQCPVPGTSRKATVKEEAVEIEVEDEDDCFVSEPDRSDDILGMILCKIDEAQEKAKGLRKRVHQLLCESQAVVHTSLLPATVAQSQRDFTVENVKQLALVEEEPLMPQREGTVQIGRQRISADHTEDLLIPPQAGPIFESDGQFLYNNSPLPYERLGFPKIEDMLMDGSEMNGYEAEPELDHCFMKLMSEFGGETMLEEADDQEEEEDPTPVTKRRKTSH